MICIHVDQNFSWLALSRLGVFGANYRLIVVAAGRDLPKASQMRIGGIILRAANVLIQRLQTAAPTLTYASKPNGSSGLEEKVCLTSPRFILGRVSVCVHLPTFRSSHPTLLELPAFVGCVLGIRSRSISC